MIDWINEMCKVWGKQVRARLADPKERKHEDGWPSTSILGKVKEEWEGAGHRSGGPPVQPIYPGFTGDALEIHRAIFGPPKIMDFDLYATLKVHYCVVRAPAKSKVQLLQLVLGETVSIRDYWERIDRAHYFMSARLPGRAESVRTKNTG